MAGNYWNLTFFKSVITMSLIVLLSSCAHTIYINHNAFANTKAIPCGFPPLTSFTVEPISSQKDDMLNAEITNKIEHILHKHGYSVKEEMQAHYYILFDYRMERTDKTIQVEKYVPGQTITSYGTVLSNGRAKLYQGETQTAGTCVYVPEVHTFFTKSITIEVYESQDYRTKQHSHPLWKETAICCDENDDLRDSIDYLLITAFKYFGRNTQRNLETIISSDDKEVSSLRAEVFAPYAA